jgi:hypothetical protein
MIEMHIRPREVLRCESRPPRRELGLLRWSLAATLVLAAALDALWLVPVPVSRPAKHHVVEAPHPSYGEMQRRRCRKLLVDRELTAARARVRALEAESSALQAGGELESRAVEVTLVRAPR